MVQTIVVGPCLPTRNAVENDRPGNEQWTAVVVEEDCGNHGRTSLRNGQATHGRHVTRCCETQTAETQCTPKRSPGVRGFNNKLRVAYIQRDSGHINDVCHVVLLTEISALGGGWRAGGRRRPLFAGASRCCAGLLLTLSLVLVFAENLAEYFTHRRQLRIQPEQFFVNNIRTQPESNRLLLSSLSRRRFRLENTVTIYC